MAYIGNSPNNIQQARTAEYEFTATAGQTAFSGVDNNGLTLDLLNANQNEVFLNGSRLVSDDDFTVSGDTLTLTSAAALNDILVVKTQSEVLNAGTYTKAESDSRYVNYSGDIINGDLQISGEVDAGSLIVDTDTLYVDATNDRVGIGTPSPSATLDVNSTVNGVQAHFGTPSDRELIISSASSGGYDDALTKFHKNSSVGEFAFSNAGGERVRIDGSGNVGIGATSPNSKLTVSAGSGGTILELNRSNTNTTGTVGAISFTASDGHVVSAINVVGDGDNEGGDIQFRTTSNASGTNYYTDTDVKMTIQNDGIVKIGQYNAGIPTGSAVTNSVLNVYSDTNLGTTAGDELKLLSLSGSSGNQSALTFRHRRLVDGNTFFSDAFTLTQDVDNTEKVYSYMKFHDGAVVVDNNLGIGTNNPATPLDVHHATVPIVRIKATSSSGQAALYLDGYSDGGSTQRASRINFRKDTTTEWSIINDYTQSDSNRLDFEYDGSSKITFTGDGKVGIGTSSPNYDLVIHNSSGPTLRLDTNLAAANASVVMTESNGTSSANGGFIRYNGSDNRLELGVGTSWNTTRMVISRDTGNVGIGKTNPSTELDVVGTIGQSFEGETWPSAVRKIYKGTITDSGSVNLFTLNGAELPFAGTIYISAYKSGEGVSGVWTAACIYPTVTPVVNQQSYVTRSDEFINLTWSVSNYSPTLRADFGNFSGTTYYTILVDGIVNQTYGTEEGSL